MAWLHLRNGGEGGGSASGVGGKGCSSGGWVGGEGLGDREGGGGAQLALQAAQATARRGEGEIGDGGGLGAWVGGSRGGVVVV